MVETFGLVWPTGAKEQSVIVIKADLDACMGYGNCVLDAGDYLDEQDGTVIVRKSDVSPEDVGRVEEAIASCPVMALSLHRS